MTADAVLTYGKGGVVIMACTAGLTLVHVVHGRPFPGVTEPEYAGMAVGATVNGYVKGVAEFHGPGAGHLHVHIPRQMTAGTVIQVKCLLASMAGAARFPFFHPGHGHGRVSTGLEEAGVAFLASKFPGVGPMGEGDVPGRPYGESQIPYLMAAAACGKGEGDPVVTRPARFSFLHLGHGYGALTFLLVYLLVTDEAVIVNRRRVQVFSMAEYGGSRVADGKDHIYYIRGKNLGANSPGGGQRQKNAQKEHGIFLKGKAKVSIDVAILLLKKNAPVKVFVALRALK